MNSKERILTAFDQREADWIPRWCGASPEFWDKAKKELKLDDEGLRIRFGDDFRRVTAVYEDDNLSSGNGGDKTPFGIERKGVGYGQPLVHPLSGATMKDIHEYLTTRLGEHEELKKCLDYYKEEGIEWMTK